MKFHASANVEDGARLDYRAKGFFREGQNNFFDVRVTNADTMCQRDKTLKAVLRAHEMEKKTMYNVRVMEVEHGTFTPIILTTKGVMGPECAQYHKILAQKLSEKTGDRYEDVTRMIRVKISFLVIKAALLCLRGSRSMYTTNNNSEQCDDFAFSVNELGLIR